VISRTDPRMLEHRRVRDLPDYLRQGDAMVVNETRVLRARIAGVRQDTGGKVEGLFLEAANDGRHWRMLLRSNGKLHVGQVIRLRDAQGADTSQSLRLIEKHDDSWLVEPSPLAP